MAAYGTVEDYKDFLNEHANGSSHFFIGAMKAVLEEKDCTKTETLKKAQNLMKAYIEIRK